MLYRGKHDMPTVGIQEEYIGRLMGFPSDAFEGSRNSTVRSATITEGGGGEREEEGGHGPEARPGREGYTRGRRGHGFIKRVARVGPLQPKYRRQ